MVQAHQIKDNSPWSLGKPLILGNLNHHHHNNLAETGPAEKWEVRKVNRQTEEHMTTGAWSEQLTWSHTGWLPLDCDLELIWWTRRVRTILVNRGWKKSLVSLAYRMRRSFGWGARNTPISHSTVKFATLRPGFGDHHRHTMEWSFVWDFKQRIINRCTRRRRLG